jgi:MFS transporter, DHA2 family, multidrug resistance protein
VSKGADGKADALAWMAVAAGTIGSLMATIDVSVVSASLPTIQGEIGASPTEGTWIGTAYLVAEIIMIPLAGWFDRIFGLRNFLLGCTILFTGFSILCGLSDSLGMMIVGRIGQGFSGGAMIPTALTIVSTRLPPSQRPVGLAMFGFTTVFGPVAGPILGGYLTENFSWHYAFFINVPLGIGLLGLLVVGLKAEKAKLGLIAQADWLGIFGLTLALGALTVVLEEGQRERWLESTFINRLIVVSIVGFALLAVGQLTARSPVIQLKILFTRSFGSVFLLGLLAGAGLYGVMYVLPQFLTALADYNAFQSGLVTFVIGVPSLLMMTVYPLLEKRLDLRIGVAFGLVLYGIGCLMNAHLSQSYTGTDFVYSLIIIGFGQFFALMFLNSAATTAVDSKLVEDASGLFNAARNLGGSVGLAMIAVLREQRSWFQSEQLSEGLTANSVQAQEYLTASVMRLGRGDAVAGLERAYAGLNQSFQLTGTALAFADIFLLFGVMMLCALPLTLLLRPLPKSDIRQSA